jgi:hypothetical protein
MNPRKPFPVLPHELFFGAFLLLTWARLGFAEGFAGVHALTYLALFAGGVALIVACSLRETPLRWRLRLLYFPITMNLVFLGLGPVVAAVHTGRADPVLQDIDHAIVGTNLSLRMEAATTPLLTDLLSFCYLLFFPYLTFSQIYAFCGPLETLKKFCIGLFTIYGIGFIGYSLVPAVGPYVAMADQFRVPLTGGALTRWNAAVVHAGSNGVDVFPSLHCAISFFMLFFDRSHNKWRFRAYLVPCIGLWISTIYLRYHYAIDLIVGFALSAFALWLSSRWPRKEASNELSAPV